jgi:hypothetical protein
VTADPVPNNPISVHHRQRTVCEADPRRIDVIVAFEFLEVQARMPRIVLENSIGTLGIALNV